MKGQDALRAWEYSIRAERLNVKEYFWRGDNNPLTYCRVMLYSMSMNEKAIQRIMEAKEHMTAEQIALKVGASIWTVLRWLRTKRISRVYAERVLERL